MNVRYRRDVSHSYMIISGGREFENGAYTVRMITENQIPGMLQCHIEMLNGEKLFCYDVTSKQSLSSVMEFKDVDRSFLEGLFVSVKSMFGSAAEYLLPPDGLLLEPDYIYFDAGMKNAWFCYYPGVEGSFDDQVRNLGEQLLPHLKHSSREAVAAGYLFYQKSCEGGFSSGTVGDILEALRPAGGGYYRDQSDGSGTGGYKRAGDYEEGISGKDDKTSGYIDVEKEFFDFRPDSEKSGDITEPDRVGFFSALKDRRMKKTEKRKTRRTEKAERKKAEKTERNKTGKGERKKTGKAERKETEKAERKAEKREVWESEKAENNTYPHEDIRHDLQDEETGLLSENDAEGPGSVRAWLAVYDEHGDRRFPLKKDRYIIGKKAGTADVLLQSVSVSRIHAVIQRRENDYYLTDLNSRNGTRVNGKWLEADEPVRLADRDQILFADVLVGFIIV